MENVTHDSTPYEKLKFSLAEHKEIILDRLILLFEYGSGELSHLEPVVSYIDDGLIIQNFALIRYSEMIPSAVITFKDIETQDETNIAKIIINNADEVKDWAKKYNMLKVKLETFDNKSVSDTNPEHVAILENLEMLIGADIAEKTIENQTYQLTKDTMIKIISYGTSRQHNVVIDLFKIQPKYDGEYWKNIKVKIRTETIPKEELFTRLAFILTEEL